MHEAVVFSQPLDLLVVIILHHCFQTAVSSGSGLKVGVVSRKYSSRKKNPPFQNPRSAPALIVTGKKMHAKMHAKINSLVQKNLMQ